MWMIYIDHARQNVDIAPDTLDGAIGSNWQMAESEVLARSILAEYLSLGYTQAHYWAPRF